MSQLVTIKQACCTLAVGRTKLYELIADKSLTTAKIGRATRITASSLDEYVRGLTDGGQHVG